MLVALAFSLTVNLVALVTLAVFWFSKPPGRPAPQAHWRSEGRPRFHPEGDEVVAKMVRDYFERAQKEKMSLRAARLQLVELLRQEKPDTTKIMAIIDELASHQAELERLTMRHLLALKPRIGKERLDFLIRMFEERAMEHRGIVRPSREPVPPLREGGIPGTPKGVERTVPQQRCR
jgi:Spy/CpxP family protein refolding chaperone